MSKLGAATYGLGGGGGLDRWIVLDTREKGRREGSDRGGKADTHRNTEVAVAPHTKAACIISQK